MPKGVYDRSTSAWKPPPPAEYAPELVERVRELYAAGHSMREVAQLAGTTVKVLQRLMPRHGIERRKAIKRNQSGTANHAWRGDQAAYAALHLRVANERGKPQHCVNCDHTDDAVKYEWANLTGRYEDVSDYQRMCVPCHRAFDAGGRAQERRTR